MYKLEPAMYRVFQDKCKEIQEMFLGSKQVKKTYKGKSTNYLFRTYSKKLGLYFRFKSIWAVFGLEGAMFGAINSC